MIASLMEKTYVIVGQLAIGLSLTVLFLLVKSGPFGANVLFQIFTKYRDVQSLRLSFQKLLCSSWAQCVGDSPPTSCGRCQIPIVYGHSVDVGFWGSTKSYTMGLPFEGASAYGMVVGAAIIGLCSCVAAVALLRCVTRTRLLSTCLSTTLALLIGAALGVAVSVLPASIASTPTTVDYSRCGERIIDSTIVELHEGDANFFSVSIECLETVLSHSLGDMAGRGMQAAILCPYIVLTICQIETLLSLSSHLRARNIFGWARFGLGVAFVYSLLTSFVVIAWSYAYSFWPEGIKSLQDSYLEKVREAALQAERFPNFPLAYNRTEPAFLHEAHNLFYEYPIIMAIAIGIVVLVQVFGLIFVAFGEEVGTAVVGLRATVVMHAIVLCLVWPFIIYMALMSADTWVNIFLFYAIPTLVQFLFGCYNASYTDILKLGPPEGRDAHPVIAACTIAYKLLPFALLAIISTCSAAYYLAQNTGEKEAYQSAIIAMMTILLVFIFVTGVSYSRLIAFEVVNGWKYIMDTFFSRQVIQNSGSRLSDVARDSAMNIREARDSALNIRDVVSDAVGANA